MRRLVIRGTLGLWIGCFSAAFAAAGIRLKNESHSTLQVFLKGVNDVVHRGPYTLPPRESKEINVPPGRYMVSAEKPDKTLFHLDWQDYSDHKITYGVSLCYSCRYVPPGEKAPPTQPPLKIFKASVHHANKFKCPTCGQIHRRWVPGWKPEDVRDGRVDKLGEIQHTFDYRLGVAVIDGNNGVMVTQCLDDSPSRKLHSISGDTSRIYYLDAGRAIITSVNGKPTPTTSEFLKQMEESPNRVELTVSNAKGTISAKYWSDLSE